jgi:hypothetical protein
VDALAEIESPEQQSKLPEGYLECIDPNCKYLGLVRTPPEAQKPWDQESAKLIGLDRMVTAECPGCGSSRMVYLPDEIAPDPNNPEMVQNWLEKYVVDPYKSFAHLPPKEQKARTIAQIKKDVNNMSSRSSSPKEIKQQLVEQVSRDYPPK